MARQGSTLIGFNVTREQHDQIRALARAQGFRFVSDYLRYVLEQDAKAHGVVLQLKLRRGSAISRNEEAEDEG
jgi:hypothetical protein